MKKTKIIAFIIPNFGRNYDYRCWLVLRSQLVEYLHLQSKKRLGKSLKNQKNASYQVLKLDMMRFIMRRFTSFFAEIGLLPKPYQHNCFLDQKSENTSTAKAAPITGPTTGIQA